IAGLIGTPAGDRQRDEQARGSRSGHKGNVVAQEISHRRHSQDCSPADDQRVPKDELTEAACDAGNPSFNASIHGALPRCFPSDSTDGPAKIPKQVPTEPRPPTSATASVSIPVHP